MLSLPAIWNLTMLLLALKASSVSTQLSAASASPSPSLATVPSPRPSLSTQREQCGEQAAAYVSCIQQSGNLTACQACIEGYFPSSGFGESCNQMQWYLCSLKKECSSCGSRKCENELLTLANCLLLSNPSTTDSINGAWCAGGIRCVAREEKNSPSRSPVWISPTMTTNSPAAPAPFVTEPNDDVPSQIPTIEKKAKALPSKKPVDSPIVESDASTLAPTTAATDVSALTPTTKERAPQTNVVDDVGDSSDGSVTDPPPQAANSVSTTSSSTSAWGSPRILAYVGSSAALLWCYG